MALLAWWVQSLHSPALLTDKIQSCDFSFLTHPLPQSEYFIGSVFSLSSFYPFILSPLIKMKSFCCLWPFGYLSGNLAVKQILKKIPVRKKMGGKYENIEERGWQQAPFEMSRCLDLIVKFKLSTCFPN